MILHIIPTINPGGAELQLLSIVAKTKNNLLMTIKDDGLINIVRTIRKLKPEVVQGWLYYGDLAATLALYLSGRRKQTKLFWGIRCSDMDLSQYGKKLSLAVSLCAKLSTLPDGIIANSWVGIRHHQKLGYRNKFHMIPNGVDTEKFKPIKQPTAYDWNRPVVLRIARDDPIKDAKSFDDIAYRLPWAMFITVGGKYPVEHCKMPEIYNNADCLLSTSLSEGFPNVIAEAMSCGLPCVATDVGDSADIICNTGIIVKPKDIAAMTAGVRFLLEEKNSRPDQAESRSRAARNQIINNYSIEKTISLFNNLYSGIPNNQ